jgi:hypothetical protein
MMTSKGITPTALQGEIRTPTALGQKQLTHTANPSKLIKSADNHAHLDRRSDGDTDRNLHLALHGHPNRRDVLGGISDDGKQNQTNERLAEIPIRYVVRIKVA